MRVTSLIAILLAGVATPVLAAEADSGDAAAVATGTAGTDVYLPADFARFAPTTALDMINQVPGFTIVVEDQGRGLGQANENVLLNGKRLTSKSESLTSQLGRIPASKVVRIEIGDGARFGIPGLSGQVANLVTAGGTVSGRFEYRTVHRPRYAKSSWFAGEASVSGSGKNVEWSAAFTHNSNRGGAGGGDHDLIYDANGVLIEDREVLMVITGENPRLAGSVKWTSPGGTIASIDANYAWNSFKFVQPEVRDSINGVDSVRDFTNLDKSHNYEINANLDFALGPGRLKLIGLERYDSGSGPATSILRYADGRPATGVLYDQYLRKSGEHIGRAEYSWKMLGGDWQLDGEAAFNRFDQAADLYLLDPSGEFVAVPYPEGIGGVTEDRYEVILTHSRSLTPKLNLQASLGGEYSKIAQSGSRGLTRTFKRPKGSATLSWAPGGGLDVSLSLARTVGQLSFSDFIAQIDPNAENENSGNVNLRPQQAWETELEVKKNLGKWGSATVRGYAHFIEDFVDFIPVVGGESRGNIDGKARLLGALVSATVNLDPLGWKGAKLTTRTTYEHTRLDDPLTGIPRPFSGNTYLRGNTNLRYDLPKTDWAFGAGLDYRINRANVRLFEIARDYEGPYTYVFVENKDVFGLTVNLQAFNTTAGQGHYTRTAYDGPRDTAPVLFYERRHLDVSTIYRLSVKGTF